MRRSKRQQALEDAVAAGGVTLGVKERGDRVGMRMVDGGAGEGFDELLEHSLIGGATGSGKTETVLRILYMLAKERAWKLFVLDPKADWEFAERCMAVLRLAGREPRMFPNERFDIWRGDSEAIMERLLAAIDYADEGAAAYYRDLAEVAVQLACRFKAGPPRSGGEFLYRMDLPLLSAEHGPDHPAVRSLKPEKVLEARARYQALFGRIRNRLDGSWAWEDADSGYLLVNSLSEKKAAGSMARMLFSDYADYFSTRKPREQRVLLAADEFSSVASASGIGDSLRQARGFKAGVVVITQTVLGLGNETQREDILGNVGTVFLHRMARSHELAELGGVRKVVSVQRRYERGFWTEEGLSKEEVLPKVDPVEVRELKSGLAVVMRRGKAARIMVEMAPNPGGGEGRLPEPEAAEDTLVPKRPVKPVNQERVDSMYGKEDGT